MQASIDQLAGAHAGIMVQEHGLAAELLGANLPIGTGTEAGIYGSLGSVAAGGFGRVALGNGLSLFVGTAYTSQTYPNADLKSGFLGALGVRYVYDWSPTVRPFAEVAGWTSPDTSFSFTRSYANGAGTAFGRGSASGDLSYVYGRIGTVLAPTSSDEAAVSVELGREWLNVGSYAEAMSMTNPFEATVPGSHDAMTVGKLRGQWTHVLSPRIDATLWLAGATALDRSSNLTAIVDGFGTMAPAGLKRPSWAEYGGRIGYKITPAATLGLFADGVSGGGGIGTKVHIGGELRYLF
ncbi:MAG: hypothetical protein JOZ40_24990 [Methylobacteriaceae bacterium]|nr:hypothetical protein [Methylobacteriaceae bacterium]